MLQDRKDVLEMSEASGLLPKEVVLMEHDFRTEQPVKGLAQALPISSPLQSYHHSHLTALFHRGKSLLHAHDNA